MSDEARAAIEPHLPKNQLGAWRIDNRRVISGILHVLKVGCCWCDWPAEYGPSTTVYNRFNRWPHRGFWIKLLVNQAAGRAGRCRRRHEEHRDRQHPRESTARGIRRKRGRSAQALSRSRGGWTIKAHALADVIGRLYALMLIAGNVSDITATLAVLQYAGRMRYLLTNKSYDADQLRRSLRDAGAVPVIPDRRNLKRVIRYDKGRYRGHDLIETLWRLADFRRIATTTTNLLPPSSQAWPWPPRSPFGCKRIQP